MSIAKGPYLKEREKKSFTASAIKPEERSAKNWRLGGHQLITISLNSSYRRWFATGVVALLVTPPTIVQTFTSSSKIFLEMGFNLVLDLENMLKLRKFLPHDEKRSFFI